MSIYSCVCVNGRHVGKLVVFKFGFPVVNKLVSEVDVCNEADDNYNENWSGVVDDGGVKIRNIGVDFTLQS